VNLLHIESRSSKRSIGDYEFIVEIDTVSGDVAAAIEGLKKQSSYFQIISRDHKDGNGSN
jgi:phenylalanine-4-hydroxylase